MNLKSKHLCLLLSVFLFTSTALAQSTDEPTEPPIENTSTDTPTELPPSTIPDVDIQPSIVIDDGGGGSSSYSTKLGSEELNKRQSTDSITADTTDLFGESVDLSSGSLSFSHLDVSIPGNNSMEVAVRRSFKGSRFTWADDLSMGDWQLDIPYIHTIQVLGNSGYSGLWTGGYECSSNTACILTSA